MRNVEAKEPRVKLVTIQDTRHSRPVAGLSRQPIPPDWLKYHADAHPQSAGTTDPASGRPSPKLGIPRAATTTVARGLRYARTLWSMLWRRPIVASLPVHLQLESTDACNLHCTSCSRDMIVSRSQLLDESLWKKIIDELKPLNINVSGIGEPFLHPGIFDIVRYARALGSTVNCATNFTKVQGKHRDIVECGIGQLKVSIDAARPETYQAIRGEDAFQAIVDNIREVQSWKQKLNSSTPSIRFNFALQRLNYLETPQLVDLAHDLGVEGIYFQYLSYTDMEDRKSMLTGSMTRESLEACVNQAAQKAEDLGISTNLSIWTRDFDLLWNAMQPMDRYEPNRKPCYFPWMSTWIGADGWIRPCPIMPWTVDEGRMGHLSEQSFEEIWNNEHYRSLRAALARGERPTRSCKTCYPQDLYNIFLLKSKLLPKR